MASAPVPGQFGACRTAELALGNINICVGTLLDNVMTFASSLLKPGNFSVHIECNHQMFESASFDIEFKTSGRILSLSHSIIPGLEGILISAILFDVPIPQSCVFGRFMVQVERFDNLTLTCFAPVLPLGRLAFSVLQSLGSTQAIEAVAVAPPQVSSVDHASVGIWNRSL